MEEKDFYLLELGQSWHEILKDELQKPYIASLVAFVERERRGAKPVYPPKELVFNAFKKTPYEKVKVVIMGQDPYHAPGQAHGLSFSVPKGIAAPPSLQNIFKELESDLAMAKPSHGCLSSWSEQGVLLLNATLTVRESEPMSHHGRGWETFTDAVIDKLSERGDPVIFVLWGKSAQEKCRRLRAQAHQHVVLTSPHPSPLSAHQGFFGCKHFSKINEHLAKLNKAPISWAI